jgi:hypothetical protein
LPLRICGKESMVCNALCRDDVTGDFCTSSRLRKKASPAREARTNLFVYVVCEATTDNRVECSATSRRSGSYRSSNAPSSLSGAVEGRPRAWRKSQRKRRAGPPAPHPPSFAAAAHGATGLQLAVPLVRGLEDGRPDVGCDGIHQEPRATVTSGQGQVVYHFAIGCPVPDPRLHNTETPTA